MKTCRACGNCKPLSDFPKNGRDYPGAAGRKSICKPCYVIHMRNYYVENPLKYESMKRRAKDRYIANPAAGLVRRAERRAQVQGLAFDLTPEDIAPLPTTCPVLGLPLRYDAGRHDPSSASLDRVNNCLGYVKGNVIVVSYRANALKRDASVEELRLIADFYEGLQCPTSLLTPMSAS